MIAARRPPDIGLRLPPAIRRVRDGVRSAPGATDIAGHIRAKLRRAQRMLLTSRGRLMLRAAAVRARLAPGRQEGL